MIPSYVLYAILAVLAAAFLADPDSRRKLLGEPPRPKPMSLRSQAAPDTRSYTTRFFDGYLKTMGVVLLLAVVVMPIVMTVYYRATP